MNNLFIKCNMVIRSICEFNKCGILIKLPFYFHIKDIKNDFFEEESENILEDYSSIEFIRQRDVCDTIEYNKSLVKHIELSQFTVGFDEDDIEEYREMVIKNGNEYVFKDHENLYSFLINVLKFNETDFSLMNSFIFKCKKRLIENYEKMLRKELDIGNKTEDATEGYMILRCAFELNKPPLFSENIGLAIEEQSWRELMTQRIYIARKCEIEKIQYDKVINKNDKNKK